MTQIDPFDDFESKTQFDFFQDMVKSLIIKNGKIEGVITSLGIEIKGKSDDSGKKGQEIGVKLPLVRKNEEVYVIREN